MTRLYTNKRLELMHARHGVTEGKVCRDCYFWHTMPLLCEQAPAGRKNNWGANWKACGRWVKRD